IELTRLLFQINMYRNKLKAVSLRHLDGRFAISLIEIRFQGLESKRLIETLIPTLFECFHDTFALLALLWNSCLQCCLSWYVVIAVRKFVYLVTNINISWAPNMG